MYPAFYFYLVQPNHSDKQKKADEQTSSRNPINAKNATTQKLVDRINPTNRIDGIDQTNQPPSDH